MTPSTPIAAKRSAVRPNPEITMVPIPSVRIATVVTAGLREVDAGAGRSWAPAPDAFGSAFASCGAIGRRSSASQRTREIGIRTALGARASSIVSTIGRRAAFQLGTGVVLGGGLAWILLDEITSEASIVNVNIPLIVATTMVAALLVGAAACASATLRRLRIQPSEALRES